LDSLRQSGRTRFLSLERWVSKKFLWIFMTLNLVGCGAKLQVRPRHVAQPSNCVLPFYHPSTEIADRTISFLSCFESQPQVKELVSILKDWRDRFGVEKMSAMLTPVSVMVSQPSLFKWFLTKLKDPSFPTRFAHIGNLLGSNVGENIGAWGHGLVKNLSTSFYEDIDQFWNTDLHDDNKRFLILSSMFISIEQVLKRLKHYKTPPMDVQQHWSTLEPAFWTSVVHQLSTDPIQNWISDHTRLLVDLIITSAPKFELLNSLLHNYPNSKIQYFAETVWDLYQVQEDEAEGLMSLDRYVRTHVSILFHNDWAQDDILSLLSRSLPITFQLFYVKNHAQPEITLVRDLVYQFVGLDQRGLLAAFIDLVRRVFDTDEANFWSLIQWFGEGEGAAFFQGLSYFWTHSVISEFFNDELTLPPYIKNALIRLEQNEDAQHRLIDVFPKVEDPEVWVQEWIKFWNHVGSKLVEKIPEVLESPLFQETEVRDRFLKTFDQYMLHLIQHPKSGEMLKGWLEAIEQPEFNKLMKTINEFLTASDTGELFSKLAEIGERFLNIQSEDLPDSDFEFDIERVEEMTRTPYVDWVLPQQLNPPQNEELNIILDRLNNPSVQVNMEWIMMGIVNTFYFLMQPEYPDRESFSLSKVWSGVSPWMQHFDFPKLSRGLPIKAFHEAIPNLVYDNNDPCNGQSTVACLFHRLNVQQPDGKVLANSIVESIRALLSSIDRSQLVHVLDRLVHERAFMPLDQEMKKLFNQKYRQFSARQDASTYRVFLDEWQTYLNRWNQAGPNAKPYKVIIDRVEADQPSVLEQLEEAIVVGHHPVNIEPDDRNISGWFNKRLAGAMRTALGGNPFYESLSMHFLLNLAHLDLRQHNQGIEALIDQIMIETVGAEYKPGVSQDMSVYVDIQGFLRTSINVMNTFGMTFSAKSLCFEKGICDFNTTLLAGTMLDKVSVMKYFALPYHQDQNDSFFSLLLPLFKVPLAFTDETHQTSHNTQLNHVGFFVDLAKAGGFRKLRPLIIHLLETEELTLAIDLIERYVSTYETDEDYTYLNQWLQLVNQPEMQIKLLRLLDVASDAFASLSDEDRVLLFDVTWFIVFGALHETVYDESVSAPNLDRWMLALLTVLDDEWLQQLEEVFAKLGSDPLIRTNFLGWARFLRVIWKDYPVVGTMFKMLFNMLTGPLRDLELSQQIRQDMIREQFQSVISLVREMDGNALRAHAQTPSLGSTDEALSWLLQRASLLGDYWKDVFTADPE